MNNDIKSSKYEKLCPFRQQGSRTVRPFSLLNKGKHRSSSGQRKFFILHAEAHTHTSECEHAHTDARMHALTIFLSNRNRANGSPEPCCP